MYVLTVLILIILLKDVFQYVLSIKNIMETLQQIDVSKGVQFIHNFLLTIWLNNASMYALTKLMELRHQEYANSQVTVQMITGLTHLQSFV